MRSTADQRRDGAVGRRATRLLLAVILAGVGLNHAIVHPLRNYVLDFRCYYAAGRAVTVGVNPYDPVAVAQQVDLPGQQRIVRYLYPPPTLGLMALMAQLPYPAAQVPWAGFQLALLIAAVVIVLRAIDCPLDSTTAVVIAAVFLLSTSVAELFRWGQFDMVVLLLLAVAFAAAKRGRDSLIGGALGLAIVAKVTPVLYLGVLLLRRRGRALAVATATVAALAVATLLWLGPDIYPQWLRSLAHVGGAAGTLGSPQNMSLHAFVCQALTGGATPGVDLGWSAARLSAHLLCGGIVLLTGLWMYAQRRVLTTADCLAAAVPVALLVSPVTWTSHGVQLLIPLAVLTDAVLRQPRVRWCDATGLAAIMVLYTNWPVARFALDLPAFAGLLAGPTALFAAALTWLLMVTRFVPLKRALTTPAHQADPVTPGRRVAAPAPGEPAPIGAATLATSDIP
jgi:alpha-1,2-mannosyltransferase